MNRRSLVTVLVIVSLFWTSSTSFAVSKWLDADTMKAVLKTSKPAEDRFIDRTLYLVDEGVLPAKLVVSTFLWAKRKPRNRFQYFQRGMTIRARRIGVRLEPTSLGIIHNARINNLKDLGSFPQIKTSFRSSTLPGRIGIIEDVSRVVG